MALPDDMEIVKVILPKSWLPKVDALMAPGSRSRSAVIRNMVQRGLGLDFFTPECSVDGSEIVSREPADLAAA